MIRLRKSSDFIKSGLLAGYTTMTDRIRGTYL